MSSSPEHEESHHEDYLLLSWQQQSDIETATIGESDEQTGNEYQLRPHQPEPANPFDSDGVHSKSNHHPSAYRPSSPPPTPSNDSGALQGFSDLRSFHDASPHGGGGYIPQEIALHLKHSKEQNSFNPDELPEVWMAPPAPENATDDATDDVEMVQRAPNDDLTDDGGESNSCRSIQGKYGERAKKNPGIILRYQYELIQDLEGIDWTLNEYGETDGSEYLKENIIPNLEQGVGDALVRVLFDECVGGRRRLRRLNSMVVGMDGEPADFPLEQDECISTFTPANPFQSYQCVVMEGAVTLYFPPNYSFSTLLTAANLEVLRTIKEGMENGELLRSSDKILSLLFLDKSYNLKPVYPGEEVVVEQTRVVQSNNDSKNNTGLVVGMVLLVLILLACAAGGLCYKRRRDIELAVVEGQRRQAEVANAKLRASAPNNNRGSNDREEIEDNDTTTSDEDDGDGTTTSDDDDGDGTTTSDDDDNSTTSGSKETTTDSDQDNTSDSDSESESTGYGQMFKNKKRVKKAKNNIVYSGGGDEASVMTGATGATGFHSVSSQRTVKMKNVVLPDVLGVDINMR